MVTFGRGVHNGGTVALSVFIQSDCALTGSFMFLLVCYWLHACTLARHVTNYIRCQTHI